jgi:uncharacterized phage protein gp47/JayE
MTYTRPAYSELQTRIATDLAAMPAVLREPLSAAWARACHGEHGYLEWIAKQCSPLTCDLERLYDWATLYNVERLAATPATGTVVSTGTVGAIALAASLLRSTAAFDYSVTTAVTLLANNAVPSGASGDVLVRCTTAGSAGNLAAGTVLIFVDPNVGVATSAVVGVEGLTGGAEIESLDDWRARVVEEWQQLVTIGARSGKRNDYRFWAKAAHPSVTGALVQVHTLGIGTVIVRPVCNNLPARLPSPAVLAAVRAYLVDIAPATAEVYTALPTTKPVIVQLHLLPAVDTAINRAKIDQALRALVLSKKVESSELLLAEIDSAIATVTNQYTRSLPAANLACTGSELFVMQPIAWF